LKDSFPEIRRLGVSAKTSLISGLVIFILLVPIALLLVTFQSRMAEFLLTEQNRQAEKLIDSQTKSRKTAFQTEFRINTEILGHICGTLIHNYDLDALRETIKPYLNIPHIVAVKAADAQNRPLSAVWKNPEILTGKAVPETVSLNESLSFHADVYYENKKIGNIQLFYTESLLNAEIRQIRKVVQKETSALKEIVSLQIKNMTVREALAIVGLVILLIISISVCLKKIAIRPVQQIIDALMANAGQFVISSGQISSASQDLAQNSSNQASSLEEIFSSVEDISSMIQQNASNSNHANLLMKEVGLEVEKVNKAMAGLVEAMKAISESSTKTSKIIKTIEGIAFQTNLLALNAAVEAARAGEAGTGFSVVADEVRNLAMHTANALTETTSLIEDTVNKIKDSSDMVSGTDQAFTKVAAVISKTDLLMKEIASASREQVSGINQISQASAKLDKLTQQNAASAQESASSSHQMNFQAEHIKKIVDQLGIVIKGKSTG
jgi:methyl-accepting chemotaxis protein